MKQPVLQMDFSFLGDSPHAKEQITILNVVDVLTNMALSVVIPTKARTARLTPKRNFGALFWRLAVLSAFSSVTRNPL